MALHRASVGSAWSVCPRPRTGGRGWGAARRTPTRAHVDYRGVGRRDASNPAKRPAHRPVQRAGRKEGTLAHRLLSVGTSVGKRHLEQHLHVERQVDGA